MGMAPMEMKGFSPIKVQREMGKGSSARQASFKFHLFISDSSLKHTEGEKKMGNILGRPSYRGTLVDGGHAQIKDKARPPPRATVQPAIASGAPAQAPQAQQQTRVDPNEYDPVVVGRLIVSKRLAPFYDGQFDEKGDGRSIGGGRSVATADRVSISSESHRRAQQTLQQKKKKLVGKKKSKKDEASPADAAWLTSQLLECPICLLVLPFSSVRHLTFCSGIRGI